jgi:segregation and condensation protein A
MLDRDVFMRSTSTEIEEVGGEERVEVTLFELVEAFRKILERVKIEEFHEVILDRISVEERVQELLSLLQREKRSIAFHLLFPEQASRRVIIITFLAILELVKMKLVRIFQLAPFETIRLSLA